MKKLYLVFNYGLISVHDLNASDEYRTHKELDICGSLRGDYTVMYYPLTTPNVKLNICYIK